MYGSKTSELGFFRTFWETISNIGVVLDKTTIIETNRIRLINQMCLLFTIASFLGLIMQFLRQDFQSVIYSLVATSCYPIFIYLQHIGKSKLARGLLMGTLYLFSIVNAFTYGNNLSSELILFGLFFIITLLFDELRIIAGYFLLVVVLVISFQYIYANYPPLNPGDVYVTYLFLFVIFITSFIVLEIFKSSHRQFQKKANFMLHSISEKNDILENQRMILMEQAQRLKESQYLLENQNELLERKVSERTEALRISNEALERYAYVTSHDLKQPLRTIGSFSRLLGDEMKKIDHSPNPRIQESLSFISTNVGLMESLIKDMLELSRISNTKKKNENVNCIEILDLVAKCLNAEINNHNVVLNFENLPSEIRGTQTQCIQLFSNLIGNGIKYRRHDTQCQIDIKCVETEKEWKFTVEDNGIGIHPDFVGLAFNVFNKFHSASEYEGTGIGLATCKRIVESFGGEIWLDSELGKGTSIYFNIPKLVEE